MKKINRLTLIELLAVIAIIAILVVIALPMLSRVRGSAQRSSCAKNLKQWGVVLKMYSNEAKDGLLPPIEFQARGAGSLVSGDPDIAFALMPNNDSVYPEYLKEPNIYFCPSDPGVDGDELKDDQGNWAFAGPIDLLDPVWENRKEVDESYAYFGWFFDRLSDDSNKNGQAFASEVEFLLTVLGAELPPEAGSQKVPAQFIGWLKALTFAVAAVADLPTANEQALAIANFDYDLSKVDPNYLGEGNGGGNIVFRLKKGIERLITTDINNPEAIALAQSKIWVMLDMFSVYTDTFNHTPNGCNILYLDGHVQFEKYPNDQPLSRGFATLLGAFDSL